MAHFTATIGPQGPMLTVVLLPTSARRNALTNAGQPIPTPRAARLLIDTGASMTSIDNRLITALALAPTGAVNMHTPSTGTAAVQMNSYDIDIVFAGIAGASQSFAALPVIGCDFSGQSIDGLFGRDALMQARMFYSGPDNTFMLSY